MNYVKSNHAEVSISGYNITGLQSCSYQIDDDTENISEIGRNVVTKYLNKSKIINLDLSWIESRFSIDPYMFGEGVNTDGWTKKYNFIYRDNQGSTVLNGCYLNRWSISCSLKEPIISSLSFDCDSVTENDTQLTVDTNEYKYGFFIPENVVLSGNFHGGANTTGMCVTNFDFSIDSPRRSVVQLGDTTPSHRICSFPIRCSFNATLSRNAATVTQIEDKYTNDIYSPSGSMSIALQDTGSNWMNITLPTMNLQNISESLSTDGNIAFIDVTYVGTMNTGDFQINILN